MIQSQFKFTKYQLSQKKILKYKELKGHGEAIIKLLEISRGSFQNHIMYPYALKQKN